MRHVWLALVLSACGFPRSSSDFTCTVTSDCDSGRICEQGFCIVGEEIDAPPMPPDGPLFTCTDWTPAPRHFDPCDIPLPEMDALALDIPGEYTYDTSTGTLTDPASGTTTPVNMMIATGRLISVSSLSIAANVTLRVVGDAPLIVASWTTLDVAAMGTLDAGGRGIVGGAGTVTNAADCAMHAPTLGGNSTAGAAGSGGGGFRGLGGAGGDGGGSGNNGAGGGSVALPLLLGGCPGAEGGTGETPGGTPGAGGGAIQLTARMSITIAGSVNAGGGGGGGALGVGSGDGGGGAGGGSGGMIGIEAPTLDVVTGAVLTANGGGGGAGGGNSDGGPGNDGTAVAGRTLGALVGDAGDGGDGSGGAAAGNLNGLQGGADGAEGGGGGGGGAGYIAILSTNATIGLATISPLQVTPPP